MRYIIYGAGAIGSGIGALLHQHGHEVVLIARGEHERQINTNGLTIHTPDSTFNVKPDTVSDPKAIDWKDEDIVFPEYIKGVSACFSNVFCDSASPK